MKSDDIKQIQICSEDFIITENNQIGEDLLLREEYVLSSIGE